MTRDEIIKNKANLRGANLLDAYLLDADLRGADLRGAYLGGADLRGADLRGAHLRGADLRGAHLLDADLRGAHLLDAKGLLTMATPPEEGVFVAYKKCQDNKIIKLLIPADAKRTGSYVGRKCRASCVIVMEGRGLGLYDGTVYEPGKVVYPDKWDGDPRVECTHGVHFFMTRKEAEEYQG